MLNGRDTDNGHRDTDNGQRREQRHRLAVDTVDEAVYVTLNRSVHQSDASPAPSAR